MQKTTVLKIIEWAFVLIVSSAMLIYGLAKYVQFGSPASIDKPVSALTGMELMWAFYGYSKTYALLLGVAEIAGALLFLLPATRLFGGLLLTAILSNVILQDIIYEVNPGALRAAMIYQGMILAVLALYAKPLIEGFRALLLPAPVSTWNFWQTLTIGLLALALAAFLKYLEFKITH